jgi:hypothetical protein
MLDSVDLDDPPLAVNAAEVPGGRGSSAERESHLRQTLGSPRAPSPHYNHLSRANTGRARDTSADRVDQIMGR